jgi:hypothetical protein
MLQLFIDIIAAPKAAFARLQEQPNWTLPFFLLIALSCLLTFGFFQHNDEGFIKNYIIDQALAGNTDMPAAAQKQIEDNIDNMSVGRLSVFSTLGAGLAVALLSLFYAGYLLLASKLTKVRFGYSHWLALTTWTVVPTIIGMVVSLALLFSDTTGKFSQAQLNPFSITGLLGMAGNNQNLDQFSVLSLWSLILAAFGFQQWTKSDWFTAIAITWAPYLLIYGGLALTALS